MKKIANALLCASLMLAATSCSLKELFDVDWGGYNQSDPWSSWTSVKPGIYLGTDDDFNPGDLIAKGTDGSIIVCEVDDDADVPREFKGYDGDHRTYTFSYDTYKGTKFLKYTMAVLCDKPGTSLLAIVNNVEAARKLWGAECVNLVTFPKKYKKIADGGDFAQNYKTICQKYQKLPYQDLKDQLLAEEVHYDVKWLNGLYPSDMDAKGWVIPYGGQLESMTVCRQYDWDQIGNRKIFYGGCNWGKVFSVKATITEADYAKAAAYVAEIKSKGHYNKVSEDSSDGKTFVSFKSYSDDEAESTEGYKGYISPTYEVSYSTALFNTLSVDFEVVYTTFV